MKGLKAYVDQKGMLGRLDRSKVTHQLCSSLCNIGHFPEFLRIDYTVIGLIRLCQALKLIVVSLPVKIAAVYDTAAYGHGVAVHVLGGTVGYNICSPLKGTTVDRSCKCIVHNQGNTMVMGCFCKFFNIQNR